MLLVGAGLLMRSLEKLLAVNPGFDPKNLLTLQCRPPVTRYSTTRRSGRSGNGP